MDTGHDNIGIGACTPGDDAVAPLEADVGSGAGGGAFVQTVLGVSFQVEVHAGGALDSVCHSIQTAITHRGDHLALTVQIQRDGGGDAVDLCKVGLDDRQGLGLVEEGILEDVEHFACAQLLVAVVGHALDLVAQRLAHLGGQVVAVVLFQHEADAALTALAVDADDVGVVGAADVVGVHRDIGAGPAVVALLFAVGHALCNGVLMAAREGGEHQLAGVGGALVDVHPGDPLIGGADGGHIGEVQLRVYAVAVHIHGESHSVHVAGALAVAEEAALHPLSACQNGQLCTGDAGAAVIMRVGGDDDAVAVLEVLVAILDLVCVNVGHTHLDRDRQVDDHGAVGGGLHDVQDRVADLNGVVHLGAGEALGAVLEEEVALILLAQLLDQLCAVHGDLLDLLLRLVEHLLALGDGGGVIEVDDRTRCALDSLEGAADDVVAALGQHLHGDIVGDHVLLDEGAEELVLRLAGGREADFDLLEANFDQHLEEFQLFLEAHGDDKGLIAVAQVHAAPGGSFLDVVFLDPAVIAGGDRIISRCVLGSVHHNSCPPFYTFCKRKGSRLSKDEIP